MLQFILILIIGILFINSFYLFIFSLAGKIVKPIVYKINKSSKQRKFLILIPGYKEDGVIFNSAQSVLAQDYPSSLYKCVVIADGFKSETLALLKQAGAETFELPEDPKRNKAKAIQQYFSYNKEKFDVCIVLDADNCVEKDMLIKANLYLDQGFTVIQAKRVAKNVNNKLARLDGISEIINNHIFRKGQRALGLSSSLIGSGMIIEMALFHKLMENMNVFSGFDKELELRTLKNKITIEYAEDILIYDEKVTKHEVYVNQRRRWTYAQIYFLKKNAFNAFKELILFRNIDYFNKVLQFSLLPRVMCLGLSLVLVPISLLAGPNFFIASLLNSLLIIFALFFAINKELKIVEIIKLSDKLPAVFLGMFKAIISSHQASKKFIHTPHNIH